MGAPLAGIYLTQAHSRLTAHVLAAVDEAPTVSTNDTAQFGLAAIQNLALIGDYLPAAAATLATATDAPLEVPAS